MSILTDHIDFEEVSTAEFRGLSLRLFIISSNINKSSLRTKSMSFKCVVILIFHADFML
jgi:hypothetical protein